MLHQKLEAGQTPKNKNTSMSHTIVSLTAELHSDTLSSQMARASPEAY